MASPTWRPHTPRWINGSLDRGLSIVTFGTQVGGASGCDKPIQNIRHKLADYRRIWRPDHSQ